MSPRDYQFGRPKADVAKGSDFTGAPKAAQAGNVIIVAACLAMILVIFMGGLLGSHFEGIRDSVAVAQRAH
jgi:hypothetical protein